MSSIPAPPNLYPIFEQFLTFQGEGCHAGKRAFFVRTHGCPVHCPWCDSAGTWHPSWVPTNVEKISAVQIVANAKAACSEILVVTGGEPTMFNLTPITDEAHLEGIRTHLETSGAFPIHGDFTWVTVSPKKWKLPLAESICRAHEFKLIIEEPTDIDYYFNLLKSRGLTMVDGEYPPIWLHPEWSKREDPVVLGSISDAVRLLGPPFRAGWQLHKNFRVDMRDPRTRSMVPLGGDERKGY